MNVDDPDFEDAMIAAIAKQIAAELFERDMTQQELADRLGTTPATLNRYMKGHRAMPMSTFFKVAGVFGISASELMERAAARLG